MFKVKTGQPDVAYWFSKKVEDGGTVISDPFMLHSLIIEVSSSDPSVVEVKPDAVDASAGWVHFGKPGEAVIKTVIRSALDSVSQVRQYLVIVADDPETAIPTDPEFVSDSGLSLAGLEQTRPDPPPITRSKHSK